MKNAKVFLIAFLIGVSAFSIFKYIWTLKEKYDLLNKFNIIKVQVSELETKKQDLLKTLEKEKELQQQLSKENVGLKQSLKASEERLAQLNADFIQTKESSEQLNSEIAALKAENTTLKEETVNLNNQLVSVTQEKDNLRAKLSSLAELKKATREFKRQIRRVSVEIKKKTETEKVVPGNRGFVIKAGKLTYPAKVKIEVMPSP